MLELQVNHLRAHKGHSPNHGPSGAIPLSAINNVSFLIAEIKFVQDGSPIPGFDFLAEFYADVFLCGLVEAINQLKAGNTVQVTLSYHYDQGEPLISFKRNGAALTISVIEDEGEGNRWDYECGFEDFEQASAAALADVRDLLIQHAGAVGESFYQTKINRGDPPTMCGC